MFLSTCCMLYCSLFVAVAAKALNEIDEEKEVGEEEEEVQLSLFHQKRSDFRLQSGVCEGHPAS